MPYLFCRWKLLPVIATASIMMIMTANTSTAEETPGSDSAITIYSTARPGAIDINRFQGNPYGNPAVPGYAMIKQERIVPLQKGRTELKFSDVTAGIDPTTVHFSTPDHPGIARVLDQNYQFDIVSTQKLMNRYLGQPVRVTYSSGGESNGISGTLLGTNGGLIIRKDSGEVVTLNNWDNVRFPSLPGGLLTKPTLVWLLDSKTGGREKIRITYQTTGMTWWADYNIVLDEGTQANEETCKMDLSAWVSLINQSGADFDKTKLKLIAGDVHRATPAPMPRMMAVKSMAEGAMAEDNHFEEKSLFEYHLYSLPRRVDLPNNSTKQIELFPAANGVECEKELVFYGGGRFGGYYGGSPNTGTHYNRHHKGKVEAFLTFSNSKDNGLGVPLPAGRIRVSQLDRADNSLEFIGEDIIDHTPRNETVTIKLGNSFDVVGERTQTDIQVDTKARRLVESFEITLRNQKDKPVTVKVIEPLYRWHQWRILKASDKYSKLDSAHIAFEVDIPAEGEKKITYTVRYDW